MLNIIAADTWSSEALWSWFSARRHLDEAIAGFDDVGAGLLPLVDASQWQADGVRALHVLIVDLKDRAMAEISQLESRRWELEAVGRS